MHKEHTTRTTSKYTMMLQLEHSARIYCKNKHPEQTAITCIKNIQKDKTIRTTTRTATTTNHKDKPQEKTTKTTTHKNKQQNQITKNRQQDEHKSQPQ